jgi:competence protein ComEA
VGTASHRWDVPRRAIAGTREIIGMSTADRLLLWQAGMSRTVRLLPWILSLLGALATISSPAFAAVPVLAIAGPALEGHLNLNTATPEQLDLLPGVGPATAAKIVENRGRHPFRSVRQLMRIKGIGPKTYDRLKPFVRVDGPCDLHVSAG